MKIVRKYAVSLPTTPLPTGAKLLVVALQRGVPCVWAEVDPDAPWEELDGAALAAQKARRGPAERGQCCDPRRAPSGRWAGGAASQFAGLQHRVRVLIARMRRGNRVKLAVLAARQR